MSALTQHDADYIIKKAETAIHFAALAVQVKSAGHQERSEKELSLLSLFVTGIAIVAEPANAD